MSVDNHYFCSDFWECLKFQNDWITRTRMIKQFLFDADLVKFAKQEFDDSTNETHRKWMEEFVDRVKPLDIPENEDLKKDVVTVEKYKQFNNN